MASTELSADTRARILETAWEAVREGGVDAVSVKAIAAAAGVSRQLVYFHYGNRAGLLLAMARAMDERSGIEELGTVTLALEPVEAFERFVRGWCAYIPELHPVARALEAAAITGDEGGEVWHDRLADLRRTLRRAVKRLDAAGHLADGWTVEQATDWAWSRAQPSQWDYLVNMCGWSQRTFTNRLVRSLTAELVRP